MPGSPQPARRPDAEPISPPPGGFRRFKSFQVAQLVYDVTVRFCDRYVDNRSRTYEQIVLAAQTFVQNIADGRRASGTSKKTELRLTYVARARLDELRLEFEDFLRQNGRKVWSGDDPRRASLVDRRCKSADDVTEWVKVVYAQGKQPAVDHSASGDSPPPATPPKSTYDEIAANAAIVLIAGASSLLDRQLAAMAKAFEDQGSFRERLDQARSSRRRSQ